jgi:hypothetical protein
MYSMNINKQIALRYFLQQQKIKSCYPYHMLTDGATYIFCIHHQIDMFIVTGVCKCIYIYELGSLFCKIWIS